MKILIIEDSKDFSKLMELALKKNGHDVQCVDTGLSGIEQALSTKPDIIFLDLEVGDINGWQVAENIRSNSSTPSRIFIMSGHLIPQNEPKIKEMNIEDCIQKPWSFNELYTTLCNAIDKVKF